MGQWYRKRTDDTVDVPDELDRGYEENPEWEKAPTKTPTKAPAKATGSDNN